MSPKFSIITVCFNARADLVRTKASVFEQFFEDFEWIVVDGASTDGTVEDLQAFDDSRVRYLSEPDRGIYDAMNKGLLKARGEWVWFLNAGDCFFDNTVLDQIALFESRVGIAFGEAEMHAANSELLGLRSEVLPHLLPDQLNRDDFRFGMLVSHQAFVVRRELALVYDLSFRFSSDLDWMLRILESAPFSKRIGTLVTVIREGATTQNWRVSQWERFKILSKHFGYGSTTLRHIYITLRRLKHRVSK